MDKICFLGKCPKTLVFCNTIDRAEWLAGRLRLFRDIPCPFKIKVSSLHSSVPPTDRHLIFHGFRLPPEDPYTIDVIVASDKLSCGISTPAELVSASSIIQINIYFLFRLLIMMFHTMFQHTFCVLDGLEEMAIGVKLLRLSMRMQSNLRAKKKQKICIIYLPLVKFLSQFIFNV